MTSYTVTMESGHDYFVQAESPVEAMMEAELMARLIHGVNDTALSAN